MKNHSALKINSSSWPKKGDNSAEDVTIDCTCEQNWQQCPAVYTFEFKNALNKNNEKMYMFSYKKSNIWHKLSQHNMIRPPVLKEDQ